MSPEPGSKALLLRIFVGEADRHQGKALYKAIVEKLREEGVAGATVLRGTLGYGKASVLHAASPLRLSEDLPMVIEAVDTEESIRSVLPEIEEMVRDGLVTLERVEVVTYQAARAGEDGPA